MSAHLYFTRLSPFFLSFCRSLFFRPLISELAEWNSTISGHTVWSKCNLKMHVQNLGYPLPLQIGGPKTIFGRLRNSMATLTACIFRMKHSIHNGASALQSTRGELWSTNGFKLEVSFHPLSVNSVFHSIARLCRWRSANGTQPNFGKRWMVGHANTCHREVGAIPPSAAHGHLGDVLLSNITFYDFCCFWCVKITLRQMWRNGAI